MPITEIDQMLEKTEAEKNAKEFLDADDALVKKHGLAVQPPAQPRL